MSHQLFVFVSGLGRLTESGSRRAARALACLVGLARCLLVARVRPRRSVFDRRPAGDRQDVRGAPCRGHACPPTRGSGRSPRRIWTGRDEALWSPSPSWIRGRTGKCTHDIVPRVCLVREKKFFFTTHQMFWDVKRGFRILIKKLII